MEIKIIYRSMPAKSECHEKSMRKFDSSPRLFGEEHFCSDNSSTISWFACRGYVRLQKTPISGGARVFFEKVVLVVVVVVEVRMVCVTSVAP